MVLAGVQVDGVDAGRGLQRVREDVVARAGDGEHDVVAAELEDLAVDAGVFPGEGVDVLVVELGVFWELVVVVDAPVVVLVKEGGQGEVSGEVLDGGVEGFGADFGGCALYRAGEFGGDDVLLLFAAVGVGWEQVGGLGG